MEGYSKEVTSSFKERERDAQPITGGFPQPEQYLAIIETIHGKEYAQLYRKVLDIAQQVKAQGGQALLVGGSVRDAVFGIVPKDFDLEIYGLPPQQVESIVQAHGRVSEVGKAFGILKLTNEHGLDIDISIPRRDSKVAEGHKGFHVKVDPFMSIKEAARRRDFTINTVAADPLAGILYDPFNGVHDIRNRVLRATDQERFRDDPLRVLRGIQFAARFALQVEAHTFALMQSMLPELAHLPKERVFEEWKKLLLKSEKPSIGLSLARQLGLLAVYHRELARLHNTPQEEAWHPEGDVWVHTLMVVDEAAKLFEQYTLTEQEKATIIFAALCHDLGKPDTTFLNEQGKFVSPGHEPAGATPTISFLESIGAPKTMQEKVVPLVVNHLAPSMLYIAQQKGEAISDGAIRRLAQRLYPATIQELVIVAEADHLGRGYFKPEFAEQLLLPTNTYPPAAWLLQRAHALAVADAKPKPLMRGRDFIALGFQPGPAIGRLIALSDELRDKQNITRADIIRLIETCQSAEEAVAVLEAAVHAAQTETA